MSFFQQNYDKPGPGVERDTPRKTGLARIVEVISRDFFPSGKPASCFCSVAFRLLWACILPCSTRMPF